MGTCRRWLVREKWAEIVSIPTDSLPPSSQEIPRVGRILWRETLGSKWRSFLFSKPFLESCNLQPRSLSVTPPGSCPTGRRPYPGPLVSLGSSCKGSVLSLHLPLGAGEPAGTTVSCRPGSRGQHPPLLVAWPGSDPSGPNPAQGSWA